MYVSVTKREREINEVLAYLDSIGVPHQVRKSPVLYKIPSLLSLTCLCFHCNVSAIGALAKVEVTWTEHAGRRITGSLSDINRMPGSG